MHTQSAMAILLIKYSSSMIQPPKLSLFQPGGVFQICSALADICFPTFTISLNFENFCLLKKTYLIVTLSHFLPSSAASSFFCSSPSPLSTTSLSLHPFLPTLLPLLLSLLNLLFHQQQALHLPTLSFSSLKSLSHIFSAFSLCLLRLSYTVFLFVSFG